MRASYGFLSLAIALLAAGTAHAETKARLYGGYGPADIERACRNAGGRPTGGGGMYGCVKENCDGKGGTCSVECFDPLTCWSTTPAQMVNPTTLMGLLQAGDMVVREPKTQGSPGSLSDKGPSGGAAAPPATKVEPSFY
jgi:hypothetical protein